MLPGDMKPLGPSSMESRCRDCPGHRQRGQNCPSHHQSHQQNRPMHRQSQRQYSLTSLWHYFLFLRCYNGNLRPRGVNFKALNVKVEAQIFLARTPRKIASQLFILH